MTEETWKDIEGYEGLYQVSDLGRVKSLPRKIWGGRAFYVSKERILKPACASHGYLTVVLCNNSGQKTYMIHRLVSDAFIPLKPGCAYVDHIDRNKVNNLRGNLRRVTRSENARNSIQSERASSRYNGVVWFKRDSNWLAHLCVNKKMTHIGKFKNEEDAARAFDDFCILHKLDRELNFI